MAGHVDGLTFDPDTSKITSHDGWQLVEDLVETVSRNRCACVAVGRGLLDVECDLINKYPRVGAHDFLNQCESEEDVHNVLYTLHSLLDHAGILLKHESDRSPNWRQLDIAKDLAAMKGHSSTLYQLGFIRGTSDTNFCFPVDCDPHLEIVALVTVELVLLQQEVDYYIHGTHPHPHLLQAALGGATNMLSLPQARKKIPPPTPPKKCLGPKASGSGSSSSSTEKRTTNGSHPRSSPLPSMPELGRDDQFLALFQPHLLAAPSSTRDGQTSDPTHMPGSKIQHLLRSNRGRLGLATPQVNKNQCEMCEMQAAWQCAECDNKRLCDECYEVWHDMSARGDHTRQPIAPTEENHYAKPLSVVVFPGKKNPISIREGEESCQSGFDSAPFTPNLSSGDLRESCTTQYPLRKENTPANVQPELSIFRTGFNQIPSKFEHRKTNSGYDYIDMGHSYVNCPPADNIRNIYHNEDSSDRDSDGYERINDSEDSAGYLEPCRLAAGPLHSSRPSTPSSETHSVQNTSGVPSQVSKLLQQWPFLTKPERRHQAYDMIQGLEKQLQEIKREINKLKPLCTAKLSNTMGAVSCEHQGVVEHGITVLRQALKSDDMYAKREASQIKSVQGALGGTEHSSIKKKTSTARDVKARQSVSELAKQFDLNSLEHQPLLRSNAVIPPNAITQPGSYPTHKVLTFSVSNPSLSTGTGAPHGFASNIAAARAQRVTGVPDELLSSPTQESSGSESMRNTDTGVHGAKIGRGLSSRTLPLHASLSAESKSNVKDPSTNLFGAMTEEIPGFSIPEIQLAQSKCRNGDIRLWLSNEWQELQTMVATLAASRLQVTWPSIDVPIEHAREALLLTEACQDRAAQICVHNINIKLEEAACKLESLSTIPETRQLILAQILANIGGNVDRAIAQLNLSLESQELEKIYSSMGGVSETQLFKWQYGIPGASDGSSGADLVERKVRDRTLSRVRRLQLLTGHCGVRGREEAERVLQLLDGSDLSADETLSDIINATHNCEGNLSRTLTFLRQTCEICSTRCPANKITGLLTCECKVCVSCMQQYFELQVRSHSVREWTCAVCRKPDITAMGQDNEYFIFLEQKLQKVLCEETYALFQEKLKDWALMQDPFFRWCSYDDCRCGIIFNGQPGQLRMFCPECCRAMCFRCKRTWDSDHDGHTCEEYQLLKEKNQCSRLGSELAENGIECPNCRFPYWIARGGCMHFTCSQCHYEFCSGCLKPFKRQECAHSPTCGGLGLHCHHPRNCLAHLRDWSVSKLQMLLQLHNIEYSSKFGSDSHVTSCQALVQPEGATGVDDTKCDQPTTCSGLCHVHYVEHLVKIINSHDLDPISIMDMDEMKALSLREQVELPVKSDGEGLNQYKTKLKEFLKKRIPLTVHTMKPGLLCT